MSIRQDVRERVARHPQTVPGLLAGLLVTVGIAVVLRILVGLFIIDRIHPVTYTAIVGGGLGATAMFLVVRKFDDPVQFAPITFWANVLGDGALERYRRQGLYLHVTYGAIVGSFYPRIVQELTPNLAGYLFADFPLSLLTAPLYAIVLLCIGLVYERAGFFDIEYSRDRLVPFVVAHLVYGLVLGAITGLWIPVVRSALGL